MFSILMTAKPGQGIAKLVHGHVQTRRLLPVTPRRQHSDHYFREAFARLPGVRFGLVCCST